MVSSIQFGNLTVEISEQPGEVIYRFVGNVDETFRQKDLPRIAKPTITFVLEDIQTFNSCGIREWVFLTQDLCQFGSLRFVRCSIAMIDQINMVPESLGEGRVESFFAPYFCTCGTEVNQCIDVATHLATIRARKAPIFACERCGKDLEFDALEESYFLFAEGNLPKAS